MENLRLVLFLGSIFIVIQLFFFTGVSFVTTPNNTINDQELKKSQGSGVHLYQTHNRHHRHRGQVVIDNGIVRVTLSSPNGDVTGIEYNGIDNLLEKHNPEKNRGYWDVVWYEPGHDGAMDTFRGTDFKVIMEDEEQVEVSFTRQWNFKLRGSAAPLNVDKRYIMRRGVSGFYTYAILGREKGWPDVDMDEIRTVFKLRGHKFHYMALSDDKQRMMPMQEDRETGQRLDYDEAARLTHPKDPKFKGEVDDKYQYSMDNKDNKVHGWISSDSEAVGFWMITPSNEFRAAGPIKQDLTSHVGPTVLNMYTSCHYTGKEINTEYRNGEPWKKVLGPVFVYLNSVSSGENPLSLWEDAKEQMMLEVEKWPYDFPQSEDFPKKNRRGTVSGRLQISDRFVSDKLMGADSAYVGLAVPGEAGSWQTEVKSYQFWTQADKDGYFLIKNVREGNYSLYAWVPGIIGDFKYNVNIIVTPGCEIKLGKIIYEPPRNGPTLWEIGVPDRTAAEFYVPEPDPNLRNNLFTNHPDKFRQYGLWSRYADLYADNDLIYTVGVSNYSKDWFFAHVNRKTGDKTFLETTWQIVFNLEDVNYMSGSYTLQLALAAASFAEIQVRINDVRWHQPQFSTGYIGKDNAIARHGIHGLYRLYSIDVPSYKLRRGNNTIYLTQARDYAVFQGVMYDYIRLEGPYRT